MARYCTKHSSVNIDEHNNRCPACEHESKEPPPDFCMKHDNPVPFIDGSCIVCAEELKIISVQLLETDDSHSRYLVVFTKDSREPIHNELLEQISIPKPMLGDKHPDKDTCIIAMCSELISDRIYQVDIIYGPESALHPIKDNQERISALEEGQRNFNGYILDFIKRIDILEDVCKLTSE